MLLVEDEEAHVELICRSFEETSGRWAVTVARSLREARNYLNAECPELVIVDPLLPDGRGTGSSSSAAPFRKNF